MLILLHFPFCPHSRFARLALDELSVPAQLAEERAWERRTEFLAINPAGTVPVLMAAGYPPVVGAPIIAEFLDETVRTESGGQRRLMPADPNLRVEVRRLMSWFNDKFFAEVSGPLTAERIFKRHVEPGRGPNSEVIRMARNNMRYHLSYIGWLTRTRDWLGGDRMSYADFAAAAHISVADYLGDIAWNEDEAARTWYARIKSRPSFRLLLAEKVAGIRPSPSYADLDF